MYHETLWYFEHKQCPLKFCNSMEYDIFNVVFLLSFLHILVLCLVMLGTFSLFYLKLGSVLRGTNEYFFKVFGGIYVSAKGPKIHDHYIVTSFLIFWEGIRVFHFLCFVHFVRSWHMVWRSRGKKDICLVSYRHWHHGSLMGRRMWLVCHLVFW
jgi:hypothetical protein